MMEEEREKRILSVSSIDENETKRARTDSDSAPLWAMKLIQSVANIENNTNEMRIAMNDLQLKVGKLSPTLIYSQDECLNVRTIRNLPMPKSRNLNTN